VIDDERRIHVLSWHPVHTDEAVGEARRQVKAAGLIPDARGRRCVLGDGAPWIWRQVHALFPAAVEALDYSQYCEHLHQVAALQYGEQPERQQEWCEAAVARLFWGEVDGVIWGLQRMQPKEAPACEALDKLRGYLPRHQQRLDDRFARKGGDPIGSGGIESAKKFICHVRLKRSGAWWDVENANQMLALRCAK
jgi:hypothetical protein